MPRSLEQWLVHQAQVHPHNIDLGLERLNCVLERLAWRQPSVPVISVAGTNGKGSVCAYCAAMLTAADYRVGTFSSPHLREYRERIRVHDAGRHFPRSDTSRTMDLDEARIAGLGVFLIRTLMDEVSYDVHPEVGTDLLMVKRLPGRPG